MNRTELLYAVAAAGANVLGAAAVVTRTRWSLRALDAMLALAAGFIISVSLLELFPAAIAARGAAGATVVLVAYLLVHLTQHTLGRHFHFGEETHRVTRLVSVSALIGLLMHTFVDGVAVASGVMVGSSVGVLVFIGVLLHKFPEGLAISSLFLAAGARRTTAVAAAGAIGAATLLGVALTEEVAALRSHGLAISAGVTIYVGASNLVPELQARGGWATPLSFLAGCGAYFATRALL